MAKLSLSAETPIIFNIVFDPVGAELVASLQAPGGRLTGVTNGVPIKDQFDAFRSLRPIKKLAVLFNAREPNSNIIERAVKDWAATANVEVISRRVVPDNASLDETLNEIASGSVGVDAVYAGADNYLASVSGKIAGALGDKVDLFGGTETYVWSGWLAAFTPSVSDMGVAAAERTTKILGGASPAETPVVLPAPKLFVSKSAAAKRGVVPPEGAVIKD